MVGKGYTYKQKNTALLLGTPLFLLLAYLLSISNTLEQWKQGEQLQEQLSQAEGAPQKIALLEQKLAYWDKLAASAGDSSMNIQKELFTNVSRACNAQKATLRALSYVGTEEKEGHLVDTYQVEMEGPFKNLLQAVHALEEGGGKGVISSLEFVKEKNRYTKKDYLLAKLYIQSIQ